MHIDYSSLAMHTESDVEQKFVMPFLTGEAYLSIPVSNIQTKEYLKPTVLDKTAGKGTGYYPDYSAWFSGFPLLIVEVKTPDVEAHVGYREASLYARHLNQGYGTNINPCRVIMATNGKILLLGYWDADPNIIIEVDTLVPGSKNLEDVRDICGCEMLARQGEIWLRRAKDKGAERPFTKGGGQAIINARKQLNTFAADVSPVLRKYFSSTNQDNTREIAEKAYVSSSEITEYDRVLEALLKERLSVRRDTIVQPLEPGRRSEPRVASALTRFADERPAQGQLQIIQGAVGTGKSLFIRRYKEVLQPIEFADRTRWAFVDCNPLTSAITSPEVWICQQLISSFETENPLVDLSSPEALKGIFARKIQKRRAIYGTLSKAQAAMMRAQDLSSWQDDPVEFVRGLSEWVFGSRNEILVVVMDNVDKLNLEDQLQAFQLSLWVMELTRAFIVLQMRDETYERFKSRPPLDTFRSSITFHISPPRFIDVVKRRLDLGLEYLARNAPAVQTYTLENGLRITLPSSDLGHFLQQLYIELFGKNRNVARVLEAIAGHDVRRALEMFASIITSGHLSETAITSAAKGAGTFPITEQNVLRIIMRTDYILASDRSGFTFNIFNYDAGLEKPDNFIVVEILYFLASNRKVVGQIGLEGYFTCKSIADHLQRLGYVPADTLVTLNTLLKKELIAADHMSSSVVTFDDAVKILASGFIHLRVLPERLEYCAGIIPTVPVSDPKTLAILTQFVEREVRIGSVSPLEQARAMHVLYDYLWSARERQRKTNPFAAGWDSGADFVLHRMNEALDHFTNRRTTFNTVTSLDV